MQPSRTKETCKRCFLALVILYLLNAQVKAHVSDKPYSAYSKQKTQGSVSDSPGFLAELLQYLQEGLKNLLGREAMQQVSEFVSQFVKMVAEGLTVAVKQLSKVLRELLDALGLDGDKFVEYLNVTPDVINTILNWTVIALIAYLVLSFVLGLAFSIVMRIFWWLKIVLFLSAFLYIIAVVENTVHRATILLGLVVFYILLGKLFNSSNPQSNHLEKEVCRLQNQISDLSWKLSRVTQPRRGDMENYE